MIRSVTDAFDGISPYYVHAICLQFDPVMIWGLSLFNLAVWACYMAISLTFLRPAVYDRFPAARLFFWFIHACGWSHLVSVVVIWTPYYWLSFAVMFLTAAVSIPAAVAFKGLADYWGSEDEKAAGA